MRYAAVARRELGVPTAFDSLAPWSTRHLSRPRPWASPIEQMAPLVAGVLAARQLAAWFSAGNDGLDELTTTGPSRVWEIRNGEVTEEMFDPSDLGIRTATLEELRGGDAVANAAVVRAVLGGAPGPARDAALLNAAAGLVAFDLDAVGPLAERMAGAFKRAEQSIESGAAAAVLDRWVALSQTA